MHTTDVAVIGAGPSGLFSVFECGMLGLKCHVFDALNSIGGQCSALYPEKPIYDIPAYPQITALELIEKLSQQIAPFHPTFSLGERVEAIEKKDPEGRFWHLKGTLGTQVEAKAIIIAAGAGAFGPNRPPLDNILSFEPLSVHYAVTNRDLYKGKKVVIAGGGDSAVDWALNLCESAASIHVIHRRPRFRCAPESENRLKVLAGEGKITLHIPFQLSRLEGENGELQKVYLASLNGEEERAIEADFLLPFFGLSTDLGPIAQWGLQLTKNHIEVEPLTQKTSEPGIYAVGDVAHYVHKHKLILCAFAEGAQAAYAIRDFLHPGESFHFEYSTTSGVRAT